VITAPAFNLHNALLVRKHVHALMLTTLFRLVQNANGSLTAGDADELTAVLGACFPSHVHPWFFHDDGSILSQPASVEILRGLVSKHEAALLSATKETFEAFWPPDDASLVNEEAMRRYLRDATSELASVLQTIWRRLQWHRRQLDELAAVRQRRGALNEEEAAFERRRNEFINRLKGESRRQRRHAEGFDETATYAVLAAEGFLPGYGLDRGSVNATALANRAYGGSDFELPRPTALALREYIPGNLIYANGERYVPRTFHLLADEAEAFTVDVQNEAVAPATGSSGLGASSIRAVPICDVDAPHISRISDEEDFRFQMPVCVWGYERGRHDGGMAYRAGETAFHLCRATHLRLVNVGAKDRVRLGELGYPACLVSGQTRSPYVSQAELVDFRRTQVERYGRPIEEHLGFFADVIADTLKFPGQPNRTRAYSIGEAIRMAAASVLDMEVDDLQLLVVGAPGDEKVDLLIYDPMPGGSGLLHQILASWQEVLVEGQRFCQSCEGQCASSCIDCLRTFRNAFYHEHLDRHIALTTLAKCAGELHEEHQIPGQQPETSPSTANELPVNEAEDLLLDYLLSAGLPQSECQRSSRSRARFKAPRQTSTTPMTKLRAFASTSTA
jgi:hypothetical protein